MVDIVVEGLTKRFGGNTAVDDLNLEIRSGEFLTLLGSSGCGKTTTLRCIAGLERPDEGRIWIGGRKVVDAAEDVFVPPDKRNIGMVFQSYALWPHMTVYANVAYPLRVRKAPKATIDQEVRAALAAVGLSPYADRMATLLSGGQQQRVALARAMVGNPSLMLFDEPLSNLDARLRSDMRTELRALRQRIGATSVYVTHDQVEALTLSDRIVVMSAGRIQQIGTPQEIYANPQTEFVASFLGFDNCLTGTLTDHRDGEYAVDLDRGNGSIRVRSRAQSPSVDVGAPVSVAIRSSGLRLAPAAEPARPGECRLEGSVAVRMYLGEHVEYAVDVDGNRLVVRGRAGGLDDAAPAALLEEGQPVTVTVNPERAVVFPRAGSPAVPTPGAAPEPAPGTTPQRERVLATTSSASAPRPSKSVDSEEM